MDDEQIYFELKNLIDTMPQMHGVSTNHETMTWLGRCAALVEQAAPPHDAVGFAQAMDAVIGEPMIVRHAPAVDKVRSILYRTFARAESKAAPSLRGAYIPAGNSFDALAAVGKVFSTATKELLIVDPYLDAKLLSDFVPLASEKISLRLLADTHYVKSSFQPACKRWVQQYGNRQFEARLTPPRQLHDRLIVVDDKDVWIVTQSFKDLAERAPASVSRFEPEPAQLKLDSYRAMWTAAQPA